MKTMFLWQLMSVVLTADAPAQDSHQTSYQFFVVAPRQSSENFPWPERFATGTVCVSVAHNEPRFTLLMTAAEGVCPGEWLMTNEAAYDFFCRVEGGGSSHAQKAYPDCFHPVRPISVDSKRKPAPCGADSTGLQDCRQAPSGANSLGTNSPAAAVVTPRTENWGTLKIEFCSNAQLPKDTNRRIAFEIDVSCFRANPDSDVPPPPGKTNLRLSGTLVWKKNKLGIDWVEADQCRYLGTYDRYFPVVTGAYIETNMMPGTSSYDSGNGGRRGMPQLQGFGQNQRGRGSAINQNPRVPTTPLIDQNPLGPQNGVGLQPQAGPLSPSGEVIGGETRLNPGTLQSAPSGSRVQPPRIVVPPGQSQGK
jgi:hypothetical protein